jgi:tyrosinase
MRCPVLLLIHLAALCQCGESFGGEVRVEIYVNLRGPSGENDLTDDYVTWSPTQCEARVVGLPAGSAPFVAHMINDPAVDKIVLASAPSAIPAQGKKNPARYAGGRVCFAAEPSSAWPANTTATEKSLTLALPANGDFVRFRIAGQFGRPSFNDKDAVVHVHENDASGALVGSHTLMVRARKNANRMHDFEIKRFLDAMRAYKDAMSGRSFDENANIHRRSFDAGDEAHSGLVFQPSFLPWHRTYLLQVERDLQSINEGAFRAVTLPYWNWDEATPRIWATWFLGAPGVTGSGVQDVIFDVDNPLDPWITPSHGGHIQRRSQSEFDVTQRPETFGGIYVPALKPDPLPGASPSVLSRVSFGSGGAGSALISRLEGMVHDPAHGLNCGNGQINGGNSADDPLFYLLHCQIDREWAAWQNYRNRFGSSANDYDLSDGTVYSSVSSNLQFGSHLEDTIWPWDESGGPNADPGKSRPPALGGKFSVSSIRHLWPPADATPTNEDLIDYEGRANPDLRLGFCYDDVAYRRGPGVGSSDKAALFRVSVGAAQTVGAPFNVLVEAIDATGSVRAGFEGRVILVQEDATFGATAPNAGVHINGTATTNDDFHDFVPADLGSHNFSVVAHTEEVIPRFKAFALEGGLPGETPAVSVGL